MAAASSASRSSGCAISISVTARSASERPKRYAVPYSVITQCTSARAIATASPGSNCGLIAGRPAGVRDARHTTAMPAGRGERAAVEGRAGRHASVELAVEALRAHLPREVDENACVTDTMRGRAGDDRGVAHLVDGRKLKRGLSSTQVVEPACAHRHARHHRAGHDAGGDEVGDRLRHDVRVDGEVPAVRQVREHLVRYPTEPDLERGAVVDEPRDVARDLLGDVFRGRVDVLDDGRVDLDEPIDAVHRDPAVASRAGHRWVDLRDDRAGGERGRPRDVDRDTEAARAVRIRRRHLDQRDVEPEAAAAQQPRDLGKRERRRTRPGRCRAARACRCRRRTLDVDTRSQADPRTDPIREEMDEHDARRERLAAPRAPRRGARCRARASPRRRARPVGRRDRLGRGRAPLAPGLRVRSHFRPHVCPPHRRRSRTRAPGRPERLQRGPDGIDCWSPDRVISSPRRRARACGPSSARTAVGPGRDTGSLDADRRISSRVELGRSLNDGSPAVAGLRGSGSDGTRTRDLRRDRPAL